MPLVDLSSEKDTAMRALGLMNQLYDSMVNGTAQLIRLLADKTNNGNAKTTVIDQMGENAQIYLTFMKASAEMLNTVTPGKVDLAAITKVFDTAVPKP